MQAYELNQMAFAHFALFAANSFYKKIFFAANYANGAKTENSDVSE